MSKSPTLSKSDKAALSNSVSRPSRSGSTGSVCEDIVPLTIIQREIVAAYWPLSRKAAAEIKKKIRSKRSLSTTEEDFIDDHTTDTLVKLVQKLEKEDQVGAYLLVAFQNVVKWYKPPKREAEELSDEVAESIESKPEWFDVVDYTGCPHADIVKGVLEKHKLAEMLSPAEYSKWYRCQKQEVQTYLRKLYELDK